MFCDNISFSSNHVQYAVILAQDLSVADDSRFAAAHISGGGVCLYGIYQRSGRTAVSVRIVLVLEGDTGYPTDRETGSHRDKNWIIGRKYIEYDIAFSSRSAITIRDETESAVVSGSTGGYHHFSRNRSITVIALQRTV